jgi:hypothetical protein
MSRGSKSRPDWSAGAACQVVVALPGAAATIGAHVD